MRKQFFLLCGLIACLAACQKEQSFDSTFETAVVQRGTLRNVITSTGTVEPVNSVDVGTQVSGIIEKIYVDYNSQVKAGQVIAELDKTTLQSDLMSAEANLSSAKAELTYQEANYKRIKALYERQVLSDTEMETAQYQYDKARAAYTKSQADYAKVKKNLSYATIYSPVDGVVLYRAVEEGQTVASSFNTPTLFTIAQDLKKMRVIANVDEADIGSVAEGQEVEFTVDTYPDEIFAGKVSQVRLQPTTTSNVVTYEVVIDAPNQSMKLKPGLTANITIITQEAKNVLLVPVKALSFKPELPEPPQMPQGDSLHKRPMAIEGDQLFIKDTHGMHPTAVSIGITNGIQTEIVSGVNEGDSVITAQLAAIELPKDAPKEGGSPFMPKRPGKRK